MRGGADEDEDEDVDGGGGVALAITTSCYLTSLPYLREQLNPPFHLRTNRPQLLDPFGPTLLASSSAYAPLRDDFGTRFSPEIIKHVT